MNLLKSLTDLLKRNKTQDLADAPEGLCPNCWGRNEYGGQFYEAVKNNKLDINSTNPNVGWIQDYADKHLPGITLKQEGENQVCSKCKVSYRPA